ncbi:DUF4231 domain-containing protein [Streptomyces kunmingensis]|uniref:DUF4231 domain-containing protein n=1 Tax=Streptomyces kunmingensis TaxID=68225 RepID=A0ABU6CES5_9ACTN|nr:DUF4231 domain-containing protein [Streptomyces kunmingensis]MEB3963208.1 DUF4231 domain-containing protein [Streptomyces kunmingensis]
MATPFTDETTARAWDQQSIWSQAADRLKASIDRARGAALLLGLAGAVLGMAASQTMDAHPAPGKTLAFAAASVTGLAPFVARIAGPGPVRDWIRLRMTSEAIKSEVYVRLAGVTPYRGPDAPRVLYERLEALRVDAARLVPYTVGLRPVVRALPAVSDVPTYIDKWIRPQIDTYYVPRAEKMGRRVTALRRAELALGTAGVLLGSFSGAFGVERIAAWVAIAATAGTALGAYALAANYAYQEIEFAATADALGRALERRLVEDRPGQAADDAFVAHCEAVISTLNKGWMAKWAVE